MSRRRLLLLAAVVGFVVGATAAVSARAASPEQAALEAAAPERTVLTEPVMRADVVVTATVRGEVGAGDVVVVPVPDTGDSAPIVTGVFVVDGDQVSTGDRLVEVAGRPVFVLEGAIPAWRDLRPGLRGVDVEQLNNALAAMGFLSVDDVGQEFTPATQSAVAAWYDSVGYDPAMSVDGLAGLVEDAAAGVDAARAQLNSARLSLTQAQAGPSQLEIAQLTLNVATLEQVEADAVAAAEAALVDSPALAEARSIAAAPESTPEQVDQAEATIAALEADKAATVEQTAAAVVTATGQADIARLELAAATQAPNTDAETQAVTEAAAAVERAEAAHASLEVEHGPMLARSEVVFVPADTALVVAMDATLGDLLETEVVASLAAGPTTVTATIPAGTETPPIGSTVTVRPADGVGAPFDGTVTSTEPDPSSGSVDIVVTLDPSVQVNGQSAVLVDVETRRADDALSVPVTAIYTDAAGDSFVLVDDVASRVRVTVLAVSDGVVAVSAVSDDDLSEGDSVVVSL